MLDMKRRDFITLLGVAAAWPLAARAQRSAMPVIGFLHSSSPEPNAAFVAAFRKGLSEAGFVEDQNVAIEFRWAAGRVDQLPDLAANLIRRQVAVIATPASTPAALAGKAATTTIPIVFATGGDPVALGLVRSLNRPGGNATGISFQTVELLGKQLEMLRDVAPQSRRFAALVDPHYEYADAIVTSLRAGAGSLGVPIEILRATTVGEIDASFANLAQKPGSALLISSSPFFTGRRTQLATLAARYTIPAIYGVREFAENGGLMSYGPDFANIYQQAGIYTGRILKGEKRATSRCSGPPRSCW